MKKLIAIALAAIFVSTSASAAVISQNNDGNIAIGGTLGNEYINTETQVQILGPFDKKTTLDESIFKGDVGNVQIMTNTYINTIITDANGNYSFVYNVAEENKYYVVSVTEPGQEMPQTVNLYVIGQENLTRFLDEINAADTIDKMKIVLKKPEYKKLLEDNRSDYATISASKYLTKLASGLLKACPYTGFSEFENSLVQNSAVQLTNLITDATKAEEIASQKLDISGAILLQIFQRFSSFEKTEVFGRMLGREIEDFDAYIKLFDESSFLEQIYIEKYASNLTELITSNAQYFGLDLTEYKKYLQDVNKKLYGCNFKTMDEFKAALKKAILDVTSFPGGKHGRK